MKQWFFFSGILLVCCMWLMGQAVDSAVTTKERAMSKMQDAVAELQAYKQADGSPQVYEVVREVIQASQDLFDNESSLVYDDVWNKYNENMFAYHRRLKTLGAEPAILQQVAILVERSTIDPVVMPVIGIFTVFMGLVVMAIIIGAMPKVMGGFSRKKNGKVEKTQAPDQPTGEVVSAISMALYIHLAVYQEEVAQRLTWDKSFRSFSPWNMSNRISINFKRNY